METFGARSENSKKHKGPSLEMFFFLIVIARSTVRRSGTEITLEERYSENIAVSNLPTVDRAKIIQNGDRKSGTSKHNNDTLP